MNRSKIVSVVMDELESSTDALVEDEVRELANSIADRLMKESREVFDDRPTIEATD